MIDDKIIILKDQLEQVRKNRDLQRKSRDRVPFPIVAIVGYTNAGKSTLFNVLTGAEVFAELPTAAQQRILGPAMYAAYDDGAVSLTPAGDGSVVQRRDNARWGTMRTSRSLIDIVGADAALKYQQPKA
jgi:ATPase subunit of ABC transporter with duplicated ATPase domains